MTYKFSRLAAITAASTALLASAPASAQISDDVVRIGIMADQAPVPDPKDGPPADMVFLQDVIARHAGMEWYTETCVPVDSASFIPARWSRRRPSPSDDMKSVVYLCCPVQTQEGWSFITATI